MFRNKFARRAVAATATLAAMMAGHSVAANADEPSPYLEVQLVWDGENPAHQDLDFNLFGDGNILVPGDSDAQRLRITNFVNFRTESLLDLLTPHPEAEGLVTVSVIDTNLQENHIDDVYDHLTLTVSEEGAEQGDTFTFTELAGAGEDGTVVFTTTLAQGDAAFLDFDWDFPALLDSMTPGNAGLVDGPLGVDFVVRVQIEGEDAELPDEALLTVFTTVRGPDLDISEIFEADSLADASSFAGAIYRIDGGEAVRATTADGEDAVFTGSDPSMLTAIPVEAGVNYTATAFFDDPMYSPEIAAKYAMEELANPFTIPESLRADVGQLHCFLVDPETPVVDGAWNRIDGVDGWNPATGVDGYIAVPAGQHAVCEQIAETALLSVTKIVEALVVDSDGEFVLDDDGNPIMEYADHELTGNWTVRVLGDLPDRAEDGSTGSTPLEFRFPGRGRNWEAEGIAPRYIKVRPGTTYTVDVFAPTAEGLAETFVPVTSYMDSTVHGVEEVAATSGESDAQSALAEVAGVSMVRLPSEVTRAGAGGRIAHWIVTPQAREVIDLTVHSRQDWHEIQLPPVTVEVTDPNLPPVGPTPTAPPVTADPVTAPPTTAPPVIGPPTTGPAVTATPETAPAVTGSPTTAPAVTGTPTTGPATTGPVTTGPVTTGPATTLAPTPDASGQRPGLFPSLTLTGAGNLAMVLISGIVLGLGILLATRRRDDKTAVAGSASRSRIGTGNGGLR